MNYRITCLILANLGLLACKENATTDPPEPISVPIATGIPAASNRLPAGTACHEDTECGSGVCLKKSGADRMGICDERRIRGRPLVVAGNPHIAEYTRPFTPKVTTEEIARLQDAAREEHASIAAFARTIAELMAFGAPTWLLHETQIALGDEIRHTERSLAMLEKLTGQRPVVGALEAATATLARPIEDFFRDVLRGGAIGETMAAAEAETRRLDTQDEELRAFYEMIVVDESRHAALAFKTLRWLLEQKPELRRILDEERGALSSSTGTLVAPLFETAFA